MSTTWSYHHHRLLMLTNSIQSCSLLTTYIFYTHTLTPYIIMWSISFSSFSAWFFVTAFCSLGKGKKQRVGWWSAFFFILPSIIQALNVNNYQRSVTQIGEINYLLELHLPPTGWRLHLCNACFVRKPGGRNPTCINTNRINEEKSGKALWSLWYNHHHQKNMLQKEKNIYVWVYYIDSVRPLFCFFIWLQVSLHQLYLQQIGFNSVNKKHRDKVHL